VAPYPEGMARRGKGDRYHHGDLRAALIDTAIELIGERGVRSFSLAEASRRLGVAASAPYAHFTDRDGLLAAVAARAYERLYAELVPDMYQFQAPADRLAAMARGYVRFAAASRPLFEVLYEAGLDKARHPEIEAAERPVNDAFLACVSALCDGHEDESENLATAVEATAQGHAMLLLDSSCDQAGDAVERTAERTARATLALIESRHLLGRPALAPVPAASAAPRPIADLLARYRPRGEVEAADVARVRSLVAGPDNPWLRSLPLHVTASALVVDADRGRVLLRWHKRQRAWLQVGGHGDPGESEPLTVALREAGEETGLADLAPWPDGAIQHVVIVAVPAGNGEPAHEHADVRFVLSTRTPGAARPESPDTPLRWLSLPEAREATSEANLRETLSRVERLLAGGDPAARGGVAGMSGSAG
jgi:AcrR family transcriptional regulator/8-oxo-dGTP pyrophosphatase MutT (NUDIX family)